MTETADFDPVAAVEGSRIRDWLPTVRYPSYKPEVPELVVGRYPAVLVGDAAPWHLWIVESPADSSFIERTLDGKASFSPRSDGRLALEMPLNRNWSRRFPRPSGSEALLMLYAPPADGWPWITMTFHPREAPASAGLLRGRYGYDFHAAPEQALAMLAETLGRAGRNLTFGARAVLPEGVLPV